MRGGWIHANSKKRPFLALAFLTFALIAGLWIFIGFDLRQSHEAMLTRSSSELRNQALAFAEEITSSVKTIDLTLIDLRDHWLRDRGMFLAMVRQRQNYLEQELAFQVAIIDARGKLQFSSLEQSTPAVDLSDREHFRAHLGSRRDALFISKPLLGRVSQRWSIQFTRPIFDAEEHLVGVIVLSVAPEYFNGFYRRVQWPSRSSITVMRESGEILTRFPEPDLALGKSINARPYLENDTSPAGQYRSASQIDGIERIFSWRRTQHGLIVVVGHAVEAIEASDRAQRVRALLAGAGLTALLMLAAFLRWLAIRQDLRVSSALADSEERWRLALEAAGDGVWDCWIPDDRVVFSPGWRTMLGFAEDEVPDHIDAWKSRIHPDDFARVMDGVQAHLEGKTPAFHDEYRMLCKDGSWKWILDRGMVIQRDREGRPLRMVGTHTDVSAHRAMEEQLKALATTDPLTGLANRRHFIERLALELARVKRMPHTPVTVLMADLDFFKRINDTFGHAGGDETLRHFSALLRSMLRQTDLAGRLGGEEFAILLTGSDARDACLFGERLCERLRTESVPFGAQQIRVTVSLGLSRLHADDDSPDQALARADHALYEAKSGGRDRVVMAREDRQNEPPLNQETP